MKTVPTLRVVSTSEAPAELGELGVTDLPAEVRLALGDIAAAAREGRSWPDRCRHSIDSLAQTRTSTASRVGQVLGRGVSRLGVILRCCLGAERW